MTDQSINFSSGLPETVLPAAADDEMGALAAAIAGDGRREAITRVLERNPRLLAGWAAFGDCAGQPIDRYAAYRVGYHRGLDALRANGWRGSGYVRWAEPTNHGFLHCLVGLQSIAEQIGETDEAERITQFLAQLDPTGVPAEIRAIVG